MLGYSPRMAKSKHKQREELERQRLEKIVQEETLLNAPPGRCVFCTRPAVHDMNESLRVKMKWEKKFEDQPVCLQCHTQLHRLHKNRELARQLDSVEAVLADATFQKFLKWAAKLPPETIYN